MQHRRAKNGLAVVRRERTRQAANMSDKAFIDTRLSHFNCAELSLAARRPWEVHRGPALRVRVFTSQGSPSRPCGQRRCRSEVTALCASRRGMRQTGSIGIECNGWTVVAKGQSVVAEAHHKSLIFERPTVRIYRLKLSTFIVREFWYLRFELKLAERKNLCL